MKCAICFSISSSTQPTTRGNLIYQHVKATADVTDPNQNAVSQSPRGVLLGCAATAVGLVVALTGCSGSDSAGADTVVSTGTTTSAAEFVPDLFNAEFSDGWRDKKTQQPVTPPQRIRITGSLDLTEAAESIGYGAAERRLPKKAGATTDSSFPIPTGSPPVYMYTDTENVLRLSWSCQFVAYDPDGENCKEVYRIAFDVSGSEPAIIETTNTVGSQPDELTKSTTLTDRRVVVTDPTQLPKSVMGTDRATGAATALLRVVAQPRDGLAKVYFVVTDSLKLYFGELEPSR